MSSALDAFRAQREAVDRFTPASRRWRNCSEAFRARSMRSLRIRALRRGPAGREQQLARTSARRTIAEVRSFREEEMRRFWPAVWRRWAVAVAFALAAAAAFGAGYVWASRPYEAELAESSITGRAVGRRRAASHADDAGRATAVRCADEIEHDPESVRSGRHSEAQPRPADRAVGSCASCNRCEITGTMFLDAAFIASYRF